MNTLDLLDEPFFIVHEFYRMSFLRAQAMKEKAEADEKERLEQEAREKRRGRGNKLAANSMRQTPPIGSPSPMMSPTMDDLEEMLEEVT